MHSFLLIGQSNMAGRGLLTEAHAICFDRIHTLRCGSFYPAFRPLNPDRRFSGVNLGESFAEAYVRTYDEDVGLICCADGGTELDLWMPGEVLYDHAVMQARLAARSSRIIGILWHQGESDASPERSATYRKRLETMFHSLRHDLDLPEVPIVVGGLGDFLSECNDEQLRAWFPAVNDALRAVADGDSHMAFASAEGLGSNPDHLHFSADALYEFGLRYFAAYETIRPKNLGEAVSGKQTERGALSAL